MRERDVVCSLVAPSVLSLFSSLVHGGLELSIMNTSCHASHLDRDPNILHQVETLSVETLSTRLKLPHSSRGSSPTCSGSVLRSTTNKTSLISVFGIVSRSPSIFSPMAQRRWVWISHRGSKSQMKVNMWINLSEYLFGFHWVVSFSWKCQTLISDYYLLQLLRRWFGQQSNRARTRRCSSQSCDTRQHFI